jgi:hypothetical protein
MAADPVAVQAALTTWALNCLATATAADLQSAASPRSAGRQVLAVDGRALRSARQPDGQQAKLLTVIDHRRGLVLTQTEVVDGNEIAAFLTAIDALPHLRGWLVTSHALHTFPGAARALKVVRRRTDHATGKTSTETVYAVTSLGHRYADAVPLATWLRGHCGSRTCCTG